jgi:hypothetical protein
MSTTNTIYKLQAPDPDAAPTEQALEPGMAADAAA